MLLCCDILWLQKSILIVPKKKKKVHILNTLNGNNCMSMLCYVMLVVTKLLYSFLNEFFYHEHVARIPKRVQNETTEHNETNILNTHKNFIKKCHSIACSQTEKTRDFVPSIKSSWNTQINWIKNEFTFPPSNFFPYFDANE